MIHIDEHNYLVIIERGPENYSAWAPDLPGCAAVGDTPEEAAESMREAIAFHLQGLRADGESIPLPSAAGAALVDMRAA